MLVTNMPWMHHSLTINDKKILLWQFDTHQVDMLSFINSAESQNYDLIFIVAFEGIMDTYKHLLEDGRIHVWDSLVDCYRPGFNSYMWHWQETKLVYEEYNLQGCITNPLDICPEYVFDCFSGASRYQRDILYKKISVHSDQILASYNDWIPGSDSLGENTIGNHSGTPIPLESFARTANISKYMPWKIYNNTWFSIVSETDVDRAFFTEKTAKPLLAKKAFLLLSAPGALKDLKHLGFETFDIIFNESYDSELDLVKRIDMIVQEAQRIKKENPVKLYKEILPVLEHNHNHFLSIDWQEKMTQQMQKIIDDK